MTSTTPRRSVHFQDALDRLRSGNQRFVHNVRSVEALASQSRRDALIQGQAPFAIVLSCSDSRVPSELVFDCGLGDLFVVRVAGNIVAPSIVGSVEFAAATFGTELVVVMGHSRCGAISATIDALVHGTKASSENVRDIVDRISPSIAELVREGRPDAASLAAAATRANIRASVNHLRHGSRVLEQRIAEGRLCVIGAEYAIETGRVDVFDVGQAY
ncbi:MAG: carbonic anhydrase [Polyangiaceae bacterium]|nr:carbonic anhydrase [Polyangiaceae bacterium]